MPEDQSLLERGRSLLAQALKQCEIPERNGTEYPRLFGGGNVYSESTDSDIGIVFSYYHPGAGSLSCSISLKHLAFQTAQSFADDAEATEVLVDALKYLESTVSELLPTMNHNILRRVFNLRIRPRADQEEKEGWIKILDQLSPAHSKRRMEMERKLAAERDWRGGSDPRVDVSDEQCRTLSADYPTLLQHWQKVNKNRKTEKNWRSYAKIDEPDTPDDLLDRLDDDLPQQFGSDGDAYLSIPSALALEHAARRCLIPPNEYGLSTLKNLRQRGDKLLGQAKTSD